MKQLIGIEHKVYTDKNTGEKSEYDVFHIADYAEADNLKGAKVESHNIYNLDKIEVEGNIELGCSIRIFREGTKDYSYITMILCKPWAKK